MGHGLRQARYVGRAKKRLQALWTAAVVNLKRLFKLAEDDRGGKVGLAAVLAMVSGGRRPVPTASQI